MINYVGQGSFVNRTATLPAQNPLTMCGWSIKNSENASEDNTYYSLFTNFLSDGFVIGIKGTAAGTNPLSLNLYAASGGSGADLYGPKIPLQRWVFTAVIDDGSKVRGYYSMDGRRLEILGTLTSPGAYVETELAYGLIGGSSQLFGRQSNMKVWQRVLSLRELEQEMWNYAPSRVNLWAWYPFVANANDYSGNARNLTLSGNTPTFLTTSVLRQAILSPELAVSRYWSDTGTPPVPIYIPGFYV